jgi:hypothetical protein
VANLVHNISVISVGAAGRWLDEVPAVNAFWQLVGLQESLFYIACMQLMIVATASESMNLPTARPGVGEGESSKSTPFSN